MKILICALGMIAAGSVFACEGHEAAHAGTGAKTQQSRSPASKGKKKVDAPASVDCEEWGDDKQECIDHGCTWTGTKCR